jgi:predicted HicB family RNase H-like nuclease
MTAGRRARADQVAKRVNTAVGLLAGGMEVVDATAALARRHRLSDRQARRYVERARDEGIMEVAVPKVVFTVKLPAGLARRIRRMARATGQSISALVAQALAEFFDRQDSHG